eukprot:Hpha_TRINITY_DN16652_c3_g13::TRINITY_DN16652_c3_g13_i1::g.181849::m.181849
MPTPAVGRARAVYRPISGPPGPGSGVVPPPSAATALSPVAGGRTDRARHTFGKSRGCSQPRNSEPREPAAPPWRTDGGTTPRSHGPNWTLDPSERKVKQPQPRRPERSPPKPRQKRELFPEGRVPSTLAARDIAGSAPVSKVIVKERKVAQTDLRDSDMSAYPNWTIHGGGSESPRRGGTPRRSATPRRGGTPGRARPTNSNIDIEGSRPAITKFSKSLQRIVADPWPEASHAPLARWAQEPSRAPWMGDDGVRPSGTHTPERRRGMLGGALLTKEVEQFRGGCYVVTEVLTDPDAVGGGAAAGQLREGKGTRTGDIVGAQTSTAPTAAHLRFASPRAPRSLCTNDIPGARPRAQTPRGGSSARTTVQDGCIVDQLRGPRAPPAARAPTSSAVAEVPAPAAPEQRPRAHTPPPSRPAAGAPGQPARRYSHRNFLASQITFF